MNSKLPHILFLSAVFILQVVISDYLHFGLHLYLCLVPFIVLSLPLQRQTWVILLYAFIIGFLLDIFSDGVPGINSAAAVLTAYFRKPLYKSIAKKDRQDRTALATPTSLGNSKYLGLLVCETALYMAAYISIDCLGFRPFSFIAVKFILSTLASFLAAAGIALAVLNKR